MHSQTYVNIIVTTKANTLYFGVWFTELVRKVLRIYRALIIRHVIIRLPLDRRVYIVFNGGAKTFITSIPNTLSGQIQSELNVLSVYPKNLFSRPFQ